MTEVSGELVIRRGVEEVFDVVADERNTYDPRQRSAELVTGEPIGVGSRFRSELVNWGRPVTMEVEITAYDRPHRLDSITRSPGIDIHSTLWFEPVEDATRMCWRSKLHPHGAMWLLTPFLGVIGRRQTAAIWRSLKRNLEADEDKR